jgi:stress response protein SCP2
VLRHGESEVLAVDNIEISVQLDAPADLSALLLTAWGKVRIDTDLIFYNQPSGPGIRLIAGVRDQADTLAVTLSQIPAEIKQVRLVLGLDDQRRDRFGRHAMPLVDVFDSYGNPLYQFGMSGLTDESTVVVMDLIRAGSEWAVRAVGQGYPAGFEALIGEHGVAVDNSPHAAAPMPPAELRLSRDRPTELVQGQDVVLRKDGGGELTYVKMALGWDPIRERGQFGGMRDARIDLDASAILYSGHDVVDVAYYNQLSSKDGSVRHQGDNLTGEGRGDNEVITVDLTRVPEKVTAVMFVVTSYEGQTFEKVRNAFWRLVDGTTEAELARYDLLGGGAHTGMVMAKVHRSDGSWKLQAIGEAIQAQHLAEAAAQMDRFLN